MLWFFKLALKILGALAVAAVVYLGITAYQVWKTSQAYDPHPANAIFVLGTAEYDGLPSPALRARLNEAWVLYHRQLAPWIVVTGGKQKGDRFTESQASAAYLEALGVPAQALLLAGGDDTYLNVADAAPAMKAHGVKSVLVVTDPFHEDRSMAILSTFGFSPSPTPSRSSPITGTALVPYYAKETLEVAAGRLIGYGTLSHLLH